MDFEKLAELVEFPDELIDQVASTTWTVFGPAVSMFENTLAQLLPDLYKTAMTMTEDYKHPFSKKLPLMNPTHVIFALVFYIVALAAIYPIGKVLGKQKHRFLGLIHNMFLYFLSVYMCVGVMITAKACGYSLWNNGVGTGKNDWRLAKLIWVFYVSKLPEFGDTFLMMLKQNYRQISFLHVYHHTTIFTIWFIVTLIGPGGEAYWSAMLNSGIHVIMYGYYFGTMLFVDDSHPVRRILNRFKFMITKGQMTQFSLNCVQSVYDLYIAPVSNYPSPLIHLLLWYMFTLLALFGNFLIKNSGKKKVGGKAPVKMVGKAPKRSGRSRSSSRTRAKKE